ncbi:MAG: CDP-alcohol phosphatidyltransferase family protein [Phycisphaerales bacterium]
MIDPSPHRGATPGPAFQARPIPARKLIPNVLTTIALCCGMASVHFSIKEDYQRAVAAIAVAALFDALDGRMARLLRATSRFGAVLDSLADFLSFGVAPALVLYQWMLGDHLRLGRSDVLGLAAVMTYVLCAALRLARFTAMSKTPQVRPTRYFVGLPSPAAAGVVLIPIMVQLSRTIETQPPEWVVVPYTFVVGLLMVSRLPMYSIKAARVRRQWAVPLLVIVGILVVIAIKDPWLAAIALAGAYLATLPMSLLERRRAVRPAAAIAQDHGGGHGGGVHGTSGL